MKIYVTGDTHQENNSEKLSKENFVEQKELTKDDFEYSLVKNDSLKSLDTDIAQFMETIKLTRNKVIENFM